MAINAKQFMKSIGAEKKTVASYSKSDIPVIKTIQETGGVGSLQVKALNKMNCVLEQMASNSDRYITSSEPLGDGIYKVTYNDGTFVNWDLSGLIEYLTVAVGSNPALTIDDVNNTINLDLTVAGSFDDSVSSLGVDNIQAAIDAIASISNTHNPSVYTENNDGTFTLDNGYGTTITISQNAVDIIFDNTGTSLTATDIQSALVDLSDAIDSINTNISALNSVSHEPATLTGDTYIAATASGTDNQSFDLTFNLPQTLSSDGGNDLQLGNDGKLYVPSTSISVGDFTVVSDIAARDALTPVDGSVAYVNADADDDNNGFYIYDTATTQWYDMTPHAVVTSINGTDGDITLSMIGDEAGSVATPINNNTAISVNTDPNKTGVETDGTNIFIPQSTRKYTETKTVIANTPYTVTHNLNTSDVVISTVDVVTGEDIIVNRSNRTANTVDITSTVDGDIRVVVVG